MGSTNVRENRYSLSPHTPRVAVTRGRGLSDYRNPVPPLAHPRSGPSVAPFGRLACGARATHARALRSPYFHYRIISLTARGSAPAKICILQYPYRNPTSERPGPHYALASSRSKDLGAGAPRTPQAYGRYTVALQYPYRNPHPYYSTLPTIAAPHTASLLTLPPLP